MSRDLDVVATSPTAPELDLATAGRLAALEELHDVRRAGILYHDMNTRRSWVPRDVRQYAESLGNMILVHTGQPSQVQITRAVDDSKDIAIYRYGDWNTSIAYALVFIAYAERRDATGKTSSFPPGTYLLGGMSNAYTDAYVRVFLEAFAA